MGPWLAAAAALAVVVSGLVVMAPLAAAAPCDPPIENPIACENSKPGNPASEWDVSGSGSASIQGFATEISVDQGETVQFKVDTPASAYRLDVYRMGYYGGMGARKITTIDPSASLPQSQPECLYESSTGLTDCGNWNVSASWDVPADAVSGIYFAKLVRTDGTNGSSHVFFVVRDDDGASDVLFQTADTTWQAYNEYGGNSLYTGSPAGRAYKVSYNRPFTTRSDATEDWVFNAEYPMVRFLEANGYDVSYFTGVDTDRLGSEILEHQLFLSVGHDEYWSGQQRANVEAARDAGVHLAFFSGNEIFWKTRWENSIDGSGTPHRTLVTYKETHANAVIDPEDPPTWTGTWMDPRFSPPADGGRPQNELTGQLFGVNCCTYDMTVGEPEGKFRLWRNTRAATLSPGADTVLGEDLLGYEWDVDAENDVRPAGLIRLSSTTIDANEVLQDYGNSYGPETVTHHLTMYRAPSGALVFGAGTVQWAWGLDDEHDRGPSSTSDVAVRQATVNLLADMGVQPDTLQPDLVAATASTDTTAPESAIVEPTDGSTVPPSTALTVTGTASDVGGLVAAVEVSVDGGTTWLLAAGRENWSYDFTPGASGTMTILSRAVDDSGLIQSPPTSIEITVGSGSGGGGATCPCTIWPTAATPTVLSDSDTAPIELGVKFRASEPGQITGIRFYKGPSNSGEHLGRLWTSAGTMLGEVVFTSETESGWQQANFASPITVEAGTTYVASYYAPDGRYSSDSGYFTTATTNGPLTALQDGTDGGNGVYRYGVGGGFPSSTWQASNYWVDVVFETGEDTTAPTVVTRSPVDGATNVSTGSTVSAAFSEDVDAASVVLTLAEPGGTQVPGTTTYDAPTRTTTFTPTSALAVTTTYTATVSGATDLAGNAMSGADNWSFTTGEPDSTAPTVTSHIPAAGATDVTLTSAISATFSEAVQPGTVAVDVRDTGGASVSGAVGYDPVSFTATFTPASSLQPSTTYTVTVSGGQDPAGNTMTDVTWSFTTTGQTSGCPCTIWPNTATPQVAAANDGSSVELGTKFRTSQDGVITGIRFYKGDGNVGSHVGSLWTSDGSLLGSVTFTNETSSGWQQAAFSSPVPVQANTVYVVSYFAPAGRYSLDSGYFASEVTNGPLTAMADGTSGGNGVYRYGSSGGFPSNTWQSSNYWVDVVFETTGGADTTPPTVTSRSPGVDAVGVSTAAHVTATFSEPVESSSVTMALADDTGASVPGSTSYDAASNTATFTPTAPLDEATTYTATMSDVVDLAGNLMDPVTWSFTTANAAGCPCTIWPDTATPAVPAESDSSAVEIGVKFRADRDGYVTGLRFYKGAGNTGTHVGNLWTSTGTLLASATFANESASGWQQVTLPTPVAVQANMTYVASYHAPVGRYALNEGYFAGSGVTNGPLTALQDGADGGNGVYAYGASSFPANTYGASNYWVDVIFDSTAADMTPPALTGRVPAPNATDISVNASVSAVFNEPIQEGTAVVELRDSSGQIVPATLTYDSGTRTATLDPQDQLSETSTYSVTVSGAQDLAGNTMSPDSWSFTTGGPPPPPLDEGPGGPIAIVTSGGNPYSSYLAEILRAEGFNEFAKLESGSISAAELAPFDVVIVGDVALSSAQASILATWVDSGGNLIAMRPDSDLNSLLGIASTGNTLAEGYLRVETSTEPGAGITAETMQFHGTANRYALDGAAAIATLFTNATTATSNPAVTLRSVGTNGGQAASFAFDLARSIVYTRQGNPSWAGQERDGFNPIRSDDLYFGGSSTDWVNLSKAAIPQADEQQRLLANLIQVMNRDRKPLPRFWYFPDSHKAVVVGTGDDHGSNGTSGRFSDILAASPSGCSVADWECPRFTSYIYPDTPLSPSEANAYVAEGFEVGAHVSTGCNNWSSEADLSATYANDLAAFAANFPALPAPRTNRTHCIVWSDWSSQPTVSGSVGIRMDTNYYYWPESWIQDRPGFMTGSGIPMRFADIGGNMIDVFQAATQMTDESGQTYPFTPDTLLDNALGALGYYGAFTANMHTDAASTFESDQLLASAMARGVPMITAGQLLTWVDGRNGSSFGNVDYNAGTLSFSVTVGAGANGLTAMLPVAGPDGATLTSLSRNGDPVAYTTATIKGQDYAMFEATAGSYAASYAQSAGLQALSAVSAKTTDDGESATISWESESPGTTVVVYDAVGPTPGEIERVATTSTEHELTIEGLDPDTTYTYRVLTTDTSGQTAMWPSEERRAATFTTPGVDTREPKVGSVAVRALPDGTATVTWRTDEPATSAVQYGTNKDDLERTAVDEELAREHAVVLTGLEPSATYWVSVSSMDESGNTATARKTTRFTSAAAGVADQSAIQFRAGTATGVDVESADFGAITLATEARAGNFVSRVMDAQAMVTWDRAVWDADLPAGTKLTVKIRTGSTPEPDDSWSGWTTVAETGDRIDGESRYVQYSVELTRAGAIGAPVLTAIGFTHNGELPDPVSELGDADE